MPLILYVDYHSAVRQAASYAFDQEPETSRWSRRPPLLPRDARRWPRGGGIDAAIVSIPLPDEGAEEFVRELHEANPSIPVLVMLTDLVEDPEIRPRFLGAGAREVGSKEASLAEVLAALRRLGGEGGRDVEEEALETRGDALAPVFLVCVALYSPYYCLEKLSDNSLGKAPLCTPEGGSERSQKRCFAASRATKRRRSRVLL